MKKNKVSVSLILALPVVLANFGCSSTSSDPTKKFSNVQAGVITPAQAAAQPGYSEKGTYTFFDIQPMTDGQMNFVEGQSDTFYFKPVLQIENVSYVVLESGLPSDLGFSVANATDPAHAKQLAISWTPKVGTLGNDPSRKFRFTLTLQPAATTDARAMAILNGMNLTRSFEFGLNKSAEMPTVQKIDLSTTSGIQEGDVKTFTVVVKDLTATADRLPDLKISTDKAMSTSDAVSKFDGSPNIFVDSTPQSMGDNLYKFNVIFNAQSIQLPTGAKTAVAHFNLRVQGSTGEASPDQVVDITVARKAATTDSANRNETAPTAKAAAATKPNTTSTQGGGK